MFKQNIRSYFYFPVKFASGGALLSRFVISLSEMKDCFLRDLCAKFGDFGACEGGQIRVQMKHQNRRITLVKASFK